MASSFLDAALSLLGRPGNTIRGGLIAGPSGALQGLTGERQFDPTELPGIRDLPDEGISLGNLHLTPRTVGGFAAGAALDPLSYVGGFGVGHAGELAGAGLGHGLEFLEHTGALEPQVAYASTLTDRMGAGAQRLRQAAVERNGQIVADSPEAAERAVASETHSEVGRPQVDGRQETLKPQYAPDAQPTPVGDQKYAKARNEAAEVSAKLRQTKAAAGNAGDWLGYTAQDAGGDEFHPFVASRPGERWEDVVGLPRGTDPNTVTPEDQEAAQLGKNGQDKNYSPREMDVSQGPGLTARYPVNGHEETVGFSRQEVMSHLANLQSQIQDLTQQLKGMKPAEGVGQRAVADNPALANQEMGTARLSYERWAEQNGKTPMPGLNANQRQVALNKAANTEQFAEQFRKAPDARYYNRGKPGTDDEANPVLRLDNGRDVPHEDPLEEERAQREQIVNRGGADAGIAHVYNRLRDEEIEQQINELAKGGSVVRPRPALDYNPSGASLDNIRSAIRSVSPGYSGDMLNELANLPFLNYLARRRG